MLLAVAAGIAAVAAVIQLVRLVIADCDLRLLRKGLAPAAAFEGKVSAVRVVPMGTKT
jgi:hypothetical protein